MRMSYERHVGLEWQVVERSALWARKVRWESTQEKTPGRRRRDLRRQKWEVYQDCCKGVVWQRMGEVMIGWRVMETERAMMVGESACLRTPERLIERSHCFGLGWRSPQPPSGGTAGSLVLTH
jgi:hypothetical protein